MHDKNYGFSLVEIIVSLALFVLVIGLLAANFSFLQRFLVCAEVDKLFNVCHYLQRCAVVTGNKKVLTFDANKNQYAFEDKVCQLPRQVVFGVLQHVKGPPSTPKKMIKSPITFKGENVVFHSDGIIKSGTVYITDVDKNFLYAISCSVSQASYLRKYVYNGTWTLIS
ncbi:Tfp pilus assembly protein FimT/FimU [Candidatus Dependentiae bacterium]